MVSKYVTIDHNIIGNYGSKENWSKAIYLDDNSSDVTITNNIAYGSGQWAVQFHGGARNTMRNNIFDISAAVKLAIYQDTAATTPPDKMAGNVFSCNIVYSSATPPSHLWDFYDGVPIQAPTASDNLYWGENGALPNADRIVDTNPKVANPGFVNAPAHDYKFSAANPAAFCGFKPIDASKVGPLPN